MMAKASTKKQNVEEKVESSKTVTPNEIGWTDYVLGLLTDDEKIAGNPTTDGLRRIFEIALDCAIIESVSEVVQSPDVNNEKRATVVHSISYHLNDPSLSDSIKIRTVNGAADVYWGNCDKIYRNHPVAVAETRAEGRALRRALRLRKVVAAEEMADNIDDDVNGQNVSKISSNQLNFIDVLTKRLDINAIELFKASDITFGDNVYDLIHEDAVSIIRKLSKYQQDVTEIPDGIKGYISTWK